MTARHNIVHIHIYIVHIIYIVYNYILYICTYYVHIIHVHKIWTKHSVDDISFRISGNIYLRKSIPPEIHTSGDPYLRKYALLESRTSGNLDLKIRKAVPPEISTLRKLRGRFRRVGFNVPPRRISYRIGTSWECYSLEDVVFSQYDLACPTIKTSYCRISNNPSFGYSISCSVYTYLSINFHLELNTWRPCTCVTRCKSKLGVRNIFWSAFVRPRGKLVLVSCARRT